MRILIFSCLLLVTSSAPAGPAAGKTAPPSHVPVVLKNTSGQAVTPLAARGQKATLLIFLTTECSIGNGYAPEIARIVEEYQKSGVICYGIYAHETAEAVARHTREFKLPLTGLLDPGLALARRTGATVTPEACLLDPAGEVLYRGRIDDRAVRIGSVRSEPRVRDLRLALDAVLQDKPVPVKHTKAIGCYIDFPDAPGK